LDLCGTIRRPQSFGALAFGEFGFTVSDTYYGFQDTNAGAGLTPGTAYTYKLVAQDDFSGLATESLPIAICTLPGQILGTDMDYETAWSADGATMTVTITWTAPDGDVTTYDVAYVTTGATFTAAAAADADLTITEHDLTSTDLDTATDYNFTVTSKLTCTAAGGAALVSQDETNPVETLIVQTAPGKPVVVATTISSLLVVGKTHMQVQFTQLAGETGPTTDLDFTWKLFYSADEGLSYDPHPDSSFDFADTTNIVDGLSPATKYLFKIVAVYGGNDSPDSDPVTACTLPSAPLQVAINTLNDTTLECSWSYPDTDGDQIDDSRCATTPPLPRGSV
jgi:hypothetical protein